MSLYQVPRIVYPESWAQIVAYQRRRPCHDVREAIVVIVNSLAKELLQLPCFQAEG